MGMESRMHGEGQCDQLTKSNNKNSIIMIMNHNQQSAAEAATKTVSTIDKAVGPTKNVVDFHAHLSCTTCLSLLSSSIAFVLASPTLLMPCSSRSRYPKRKER